MTPLWILYRNLDHGIRVRPLSTLHWGLDYSRSALNFERASCLNGRRGIIGDTKAASLALFPQSNRPFFILFFPSNSPSLLVPLRSSKQAFDIDQEILSAHPGCLLSS